MFIKINKQVNYQINISLLSMSESIQNIFLTWLIYKYTNNSLAISLITFVNYFPMFIYAITYIFIADLINPIYQFNITNYCLLINSSLIILFSLLIKKNISIYIFILFILQITFSCTKILNKIILNKILKIIFQVYEIEKTIQISFSVIQIFQTIGNFIGNIFIINNYILLGFICIFVLYIINLLFSYILLKNKYCYHKKNNKKKYINLKKVFFWVKTTLNNKKSLSLLILSIPPSGIYQYIYTVLPFLTSLFFYKKTIYFFLLNFLSTFFSSIVGILLFNNFFSQKIIIKYSLFICSLLLLLLSINYNFFILLILNSLCLSLLSSNIICMQIKINKLCPYTHLGKFIILRNSIASISKIIFSLIAAFLIKKLSLFLVYFFPFINLLFFYIFFIYIKYLNI